MDFFERESRPTLTICAPFLWNYRKLLTHATGAIFKARELQNRAGVPNDEKCVDWKRAKQWFHQTFTLSLSESKISKVAIRPEYWEEKIIIKELIGVH